MVLSFTSSRGEAAPPRLTIRLRRGGPVPTPGLIETGLAAKACLLPVIVNMAPTLRQGTRPDLGPVPTVPGVWGIFNCYLSRGPWPIQVSLTPSSTPTSLGRDLLIRAGERLTPIPLRVFTTTTTTANPTTTSWSRLRVVPICSRSVIFRIHFLHPV